jgi:hypothetical protein
MLFMAPFVFEHFRGRWVLNAREHEMTARGESLDATNLWPEVSRQSVEFSNHLAQVIGQVTGSLRKYSGQISTWISDSEGKWHRGSQMPWPVIQGASSTTSWDELAGAIEQNQNVFRPLRELMKNPPAGVAHKNKCDFNEDSIPNLVNVRVGAQVLHAAAMNDLHQGNLSGAMEDILAMRGFTKLYGDDPGLVSLMIRIAIMGIVNDVCWDALQAEGWSDEDLHQLQSACELDRGLLSRMPVTYAADRARRVHETELFRTHSYEAWIAREEPPLKSFGVKDSDIAAAAGPRVLRQWILHPLWSFCCADLESANYLSATEPDYQNLRRATEHRSWRQLTDDLGLAHSQYRPPVANWRFYTSLPLHDDIPGPAGTRLRPGVYPYAPFDKAWQTTMKTLTVNELVITAIAIKRYELRHGQPPPNLTALLAEFLPTAPRDLMDGQPLRYRNRGNQAFLLYSVGDDATDDGGDGSPTTPNQRLASPWHARDCVWPTAMEVLN